MRNFFESPEQRQERIMLERKNASLKHLGEAVDGVFEQKIPYYKKLVASLQEPSVIIATGSGKDGYVYHS